MKVKRILMAFVIIILMLTCKVKAKDLYTFDRAKEWINLGQTNGSKITFGTNYDGIESLAGILYGVGIFVIIGVGMIIGIKFMVSGPQQRARLKTTIIIYCVGSVLILGGVGIWKLLITLLEKQT